MQQGPVKKNLCSCKSLDVQIIRTCHGQQTRGGGIPKVATGIGGAGCGAQGAGSVAQGAGCKMHSAGRRLQAAGYRAQGTERRAQSPGRRDDDVNYETRMCSST